MLYPSIVGIHSYAMCAALLLFVASELMLIPARQGQRGAAGIALLASRFGKLLATAGVLAGIVLIFVGRWSLLTPWLVVSIALIAALMAVERKFVRPWEAQAQTALRGTASGVEIKAFASDKGALVGRVGVITLFALAGALMATKPELKPFPDETRSENVMHERVRAK